MEEEIKNKPVDEEVITSVDKVVEIYKQITDTDDPANRTAAFLTFLHQYNYSLNISNEINDRQGKNRYASTESYKLMRYSYSAQDINEVLDEKLLNLLVSIINSYLEDKKELPSNEKLARSKMVRAKSLMIMLITTNQINVIALLDDLPKYLHGPVSKIFDLMSTIREDSLDGFVKYLRESGNEKMADIAESVGGRDFWGTDGTKANVVYERHFGKIREEIVNPIETYKKYLKFRGEYRKSSRGIVPSKILEIFDISKDSYQKGRKNVYNEILTQFPDDIEATKKLIFES